MIFSCESNTGMQKSSTFAKSRLQNKGYSLNYDNNRQDLSRNK